MSRTLDEVLQLALELPAEQRLRLALELYDGISPHPDLGEPEPGYDEWFRAGVEKALADTSGDVSHEEAMKEFHNAILRARKLKATA